MIVWKRLRREDELDAIDISNDIKAKADGWQREQDAFVSRLISDWDYVDVDTGQPIPPGVLGPLAIAQYQEVIEEFNLEMERQKTVPKTNALPSSSGSTRSRVRNRNYQPPPNG